MDSLDNICVDRMRDFVFSRNLWSLAYSGAAIVAVFAASVIVSTKQTSLRHLCMISAARFFGV